MLLAAPRALAAQCPDGTPPPCETRARRPAARRAPPAETERRRSFLVLPFRNLSRAPEHDWLVEGSPVLLADALARNDSISVVPDERLYPALNRAGLQPGDVMDLARVRRVAAETGGWTAVTGEVLRLGDRVRVSSRAFDAVTDAEVVRIVEEGPDSGDVRALYQRLGARLVRAVGIDTAVADLAATTTRSLDAYRAYVRGILHANRSEARRARDAFLEAVRLDTAYAQAYARLARASLDVNPSDLVNPQAPAFRYARRAAALADRLPARERELVIGMNDVLSGRFAVARARFQTLAAQDSTNPDVLEWLMIVELSDHILVQVPGGERPRGSLNTGLRLAKRVLELDPSRHDIYQSLLQMYTIAGGGAPGILPAYRAEAPFAVLANSPAGRSFVPLLGDSIVLLPAESLPYLPADSVTAARRRAIEAASQWSRQWLSVGPREAEAHLWASRVHHLSGDAALALRELETADSLGVETGIENVPARRMALLARLERYEEGSRIADSLLSGGGLDLATMNAFQVEGLGWAWTLFVLDGRTEPAGRLMERAAAALAPAAMLRPELGGEGMAALILYGYASNLFALPPETRAEALLRLADRARALPPSGILARLLPFQALAALSDSATPERSSLASRILDAATALASGNADLAYELASVAGTDSAVRPRLDSLSWFVQRRNAARAGRIADQGRFRPARAEVAESTAVFAWTVDGASFSWFRTETHPRESDFLWTAEFDADGNHYEVIAHVDRVPGSRPRSGALGDLLNAAIRGLHEVDADTAAPHLPVRTADVRLEQEPGGFRMVLREPSVVAALRRERPAAARFRFRPCVREPAQAAPRCVDEQVPIRFQ